jgi:hypothetical protein
MSRDGMFSSRVSGSLLGALEAKTTKQAIAKSEVVSRALDELDSVPRSARQRNCVHLGKRRTPNKICKDEIK